MRYDLIVKEQYMGGRYLSYEFEDLEEMVEFIKLIIKYTSAAIEFELKVTKTGE